MLICFCAQWQRIFSITMNLPISSIAEDVSAFQQRLFKEDPRDLRYSKGEKGCENRYGRAQRRGNLWRGAENDSMAAHIHYDMNEVHTIGNGANFSQERPSRD